MGLSPESAHSPLLLFYSPSWEFPWTPGSPELLGPHWHQGLGASHPTLSMPQLQMKTIFEMPMASGGLATPTGQEACCPEASGRAAESGCGHDNSHLRERLPLHLASSFCPRENPRRTSLKVPGRAGPLVSRPEASYLQGPGSQTS